jgi:hypothetical protein
MPVYICHWQNGDLSVAYASKREDADMLFDEIGNPDLALVFRGPVRFAAHFKLKRRPDPSDALPLEVDCFNEEAYCDLGAKVHPVLYELDDEAESRNCEGRRSRGTSQASGQEESAALYRQRGTESPRSRA